MTRVFKLLKYLYIGTGTRIIINLVDKLYRYAFKI